MLNFTNFHSLPNPQHTPIGHNGRDRPPRGPPPCHWWRRLRLTSQPIFQGGPHVEIEPNMGDEGWDAKGGEAQIWGESLLSLFLGSGWVA